MAIIRELLQRLLWPSKLSRKSNKNTQTMSRHSVYDAWISPVPCMWSLASSNSLICWLVMGLKEPQASRTSGTRWVAILVYLLTPLSKNFGGKQKKEWLTWSESHSRMQVSEDRRKPQVERESPLLVHYTGYCAERLKLYISKSQSVLITMRHVVIVCRDLA